MMSVMMMNIMMMMSILYELSYNDDYDDIS